MSNDMKKQINFSSVGNSINLLLEDKDIMIVSLDLLHQDDTKEDHNRNMCNISHECIEKSIDCMRAKPIIYRLSYSGIDVTEHAKNDNERNNMRIAGIIPFDTTFKFIKRDNGKTYLNCDAIIYKKYSPQLVEILKENDGSLEISTELDAFGTQDEKSGVFFLNSFILQGVCILSKTVMAGIEGSILKVLKFSKNYEEQANMRYLQFSKKMLSNEEIFVKIKNRKEENTLENNEISNPVEFSLKKEDFGSGDEVEVDKSKEAMSESDWGNIDKISLRNKVLSAKNYKSLINDVYLKVEDGWEDAPSEKLGYPIMEIKDGKAVYNRYGLSSALGYAKKNNESEIVSKLEGIYKKLGLDDEKQEEKKTENELEKPQEQVQPKEEDWQEKYNELKMSYDTLEKNLINLKQSFDGLQNECHSAQEQLKVYKDKEDKEIMYAYLESNKDAFTEDEMKVIASKIDSLEESCEDFKKEIDEKFNAYLRNKYEKEKAEKLEEEKNKKNSKEFSFVTDYLGKIETVTKKNKNETLSTDEVLAKLSKGKK